MVRILVFLCFAALIAVVGCSSSLEHYSGDNIGIEDNYSVEIEGRDMKLLSVQEIADLWGISSDVLLKRIISEFGLKGNYTVSTILEDMRKEYKFSPAIIKDIAEDIKQNGAANE